MRSRSPLTAGSLRLATNQCQVRSTVYLTAPSPRSTQLGAASPKISLIRGADGGAAHCCYEHEGPTLFHPCSVPAGDRIHVIRCAGRISMMEEVDDAELVVERIAALDLGKAGLE